MVIITERLQNTDKQKEESKNHHLDLITVIIWICILPNMFYYLLAIS